MVKVVQPHVVCNERTVQRSIWNSAQIVGVLHLNKWVGQLGWGVGHAWAPTGSAYVLPPHAVCNYVHACRAQLLAGSGCTAALLVSPRHL